MKYMYKKINNFISSGMYECTYVRLHFVRMYIHMNACIYV